MPEETPQTRRLRELLQAMIVLNQQMALACLLCLGSAGIIVWLPLGGKERLLLYICCVLSLAFGPILIWTLRPLWGRR